MKIPSLTEIEKKAELYSPILILALGFLFRARRYFTPSALWLDEAHVALELLASTFWGDLSHGDWYQTLPVGLAVLMRIVCEIAGDSPYSLRFIPFLSGLLVLLLAHKLCKRYLHGLSLMFFTALLSFSGPLIVYAAEAKQYSSDVLALLVLFTLCLSYQDRSLRGFPVALAAFGSLALLISHPALFVALGVLACLGWSAMAQRNTKACLYIVILAVLWTTVEWIHFRWILQATISDKLQAQWASYASFGPAVWTFAAWVEWLRVSARHFFEFTVGTSLTSVATVVFALGALSAFVSNRRGFFLLLSPIVFMLPFTLVQHYPFRGRLILYLSPVAAMLLAVGVHRLRKHHRASMRVLAGVLASVLVLPQLIQSVKLFADPQFRENILPMVEKLEQSAKPEHPIYVHPAAVDAFAYHTRRSRLSGMAVLGTDYWQTMGRSKRAWTRQKEEIRKLALENDESWILLSHVHPRKLDEIENELKSIVRVEHSIRGRDCLLLQIKRM